MRQRARELDDAGRTDEGLRRGVSEGASGRKKLIGTVGRSARCEQDAVRTVDHLGQGVVALHLGESDAAETDGLAGARACTRSRPTMRRAARSRHVCRTAAARRPCNHQAQWARERTQTKHGSRRLKLWTRCSWPPSKVPCTKLSASSSFKVDYFSGPGLQGPGPPPNTGLQVESLGLRYDDPAWGYRVDIAGIEPTWYSHLELTVASKDNSTHSMRRTPSCGRFATGPGRVFRPACSGRPPCGRFATTLTARRRRRRLKCVSSPIRSTWT